MTKNSRSAGLYLRCDSSQIDSTDAGFSFGGGFAGRVDRRFEIGPEARMTLLWAGDESAPATAIYGGVRIVVTR